ncbi:MAG: YkgJ family cysteine cluster protein [Spirochaetales bacterium]|nr:YkgJ family cysteine cluster protein [Spirochaetales bacterium]
MNAERIIHRYKELLAEASAEADRLNALYSEYMVCRKGCSDCCTDISLLPLEWYVLKTDVEAAIPDHHPESADSERCSLLKNDSCCIYKSRPLICRTHGLPLLYLIEEFDLEGHRTGMDEPDWQISWCDLNFTTVTEETMEYLFDPEDVLNMEEWNTRLKELNQDFLECEEGAPFRKQKRISIADISRNRQDPQSPRD